MAQRTIEQISTDSIREILMAFGILFIIVLANKYVIGISVFNLSFVLVLLISLLSGTLAVLINRKLPK